MNLKDIPKVELHRHLELSFRHSTLKELAPQCGIVLAPHLSAFAERFLITEPMSNLGEVLNKFLDWQVLLNSTEILERLTYECCWDAFHKENIRILELRFAPTFIRQRHKHLTFENIHEAILKGARKAMKELPIAVGLLCLIQRILPVEEARSVTQFAIDHRDTIIGLDLADNEEGFDAKPFAPFFHQAADAGLGVTIHSGEANLPLGPQYIKEAVEILGAQRIGHGVQAYRDPQIIDFLVQKKIPLELCPTSNWLTQAVSSIKAHPFRQLMDQGVLTTINTDDPGIFNLDMIHEYQVLTDYHQFNEKDFERCNDIAAQASFIPLEHKQKVWPRPIALQL